MVHSIVDKRVGGCVIPPRAIPIYGWAKHSGRAKKIKTWGSAFLRPSL